MSLSKTVIEEAQLTERADIPQFYNHFALFVTVKNSSLPYYLIVAIAALLWLPNLLTKGMFMDGLYDGMLAQNLAHGISTFWAPQANDYSHPAYWNNPSLSMFTLGWCYKIFGDAYQIDKIYSLACAIIQLLLIAGAWNILWQNDIEIKKYVWLPCLLWLISPLTGWCYSNNLMENTMSIFTTLSLISFLIFIRNSNRLLLYSFAGAVFVFLACLTKGPTGLFPLAIPLFFLLSEEKKRWKEILGYTVLQFLMLALIFAIVFSMPEPKNFLQQYFAIRLVPAINHHLPAETATNIIYKEMLLMLLPFLIAYFVSFFIPKEKVMSNRNNKLAMSFILSGIAASLPIAFSLVQRKFYLLPSLPVFALGFSILLLPLIKYIENTVADFIPERIITTIKFDCLVIVFASVFWCIHDRNIFSRDSAMLTDIEKMLPLIGSEEAVCADWRLFDEWSLRAYCTRYYNKKIYMPDKISGTKFYMTKPGQQGDKLSFGALKIYAGNTFDLYQTKF